LEHQHISDPLDELVSQAPDGPVDLDWVYVGAPSEPICTDGVCSIPGLPEYGGPTAVGSSEKLPPEAGESPTQHLE
jgi:hypothetical protein